MIISLITFLMRMIISQELLFMLENNYLISMFNSLLFFFLFFLSFPALFSLEVTAVLKSAKSIIRCTSLVKKFKTLLLLQESKKVRKKLKVLTGRALKTSYLLVGLTLTLFYPAKWK